MGRKPQSPLTLPTLSLSSLGFRARQSVSWVLEHGEGKQEKKKNRARQREPVLVSLAPFGRGREAQCGRVDLTKDN